MPDQLFTAVAPVKPLAPYIGGKRLLARRLVPLIEAVPHGLYCEVFMGMGGIFFRRSTRPSSSVSSPRIQTRSRIWSGPHASFTSKGPPLAAKSRGALLG